MASTRSMTTGRPGPLIFSFALPLMIGNLFQQLYTVADAMIVGRALGMDALGSVGAAEWIVWLMLGIVQGFTQGFSIQMAQEFGARQYKRLRIVLTNSLLLAAVITVLMVAAGQGFAAPVLRLLKTPDSAFSGAEGYMRAMFWGIPLTMTYHFLSSVLRALGDSKTPLQAMILATFTNIGLDLLFIMGFDLGVQSAAAATVIAQGCAASFCLIRIRHIDVLAFSREDFSLEGSTCLRLLSLGFPMAFQNTVIAVGGMTVQSVVNSFGDFFLAGFTATNKLYGLLEVAATSYGFAMTTFTGQNWGAGQPDRIRKGFHDAMAIAMVTSVVIMAVMLAAGRVILRWFLSGDPQAVEDTLVIAYRYLFIMSVCLPILYYLHITRSCIQGLGNTVLPMMSGVAEFVMRTASALLLPLIMGTDGIFYAEISAWIGADVVLFFSYLYCIRRLPAPAQSDTIEIKQ